MDTGIWCMFQIFIEKINTKFSVFKNWILDLVGKQLVIFMVNAHETDI